MQEIGILSASEVVARPLGAYEVTSKAVWERTK